jgi:signal transduction histidine kinase
MDKIKILIAEDSITQAMQLQHILAENNYEVTVTVNGREALDAISKSRPSIVISDIVMPEMDGYELCREIKSSASSRDISVILLTTLSQPEDVIKALQCGADKFITKPYDEDHLIATIRHMNENLNNREEIRGGIRFSYRDETYSIRSDRLQILNLLISTYETAVAKNLELIKTQDELKRLNKGLEDLVNKRTAALQTKNEELNTVLQQLWQAAKLATMGELASSVAHELNNPLATVSLRIESLTAQTSPDDPRRRELNIIGQEVERMGNLVTNLLQFSRRSQQQISTVDIREETEKTLELIHYHFRKNNVKVIREFASDVPSIHADRQQLQQLFLNLFTNASDAMPQGGTLTIRVMALPEVKQVYIEIADTGVGIPPEILPKVIEAFFTTKPEGKGTGLGLAICKRVAQEHQGTFDIMSEGIPGKGTRVCITLPFSNGSNTKGIKDE